MGDRLGIPGAVGFLLSTAILSPFMTKNGAIVLQSPHFIPNFFFHAINIFRKNKDEL